MQLFSVSHLWMFVTEKQLLAELQTQQESPECKLESDEEEKD